MGPRRDPGGYSLCVIPALYLPGIIEEPGLKVKGHWGFSWALPGGGSLSLFITIHYNSLPPITTLYSSLITTHYHLLQFITYPFVSCRGGPMGVVPECSTGGRLVGVQA